MRTRKTWAIVAERGYADEIRGPATTARLRNERAKALGQASDPLHRLRLLLLEQSPNHIASPDSMQWTSASTQVPDTFPDVGIASCADFVHIPFSAIGVLCKRARLVSDWACHGFSH